MVNGSRNKAERMSRTEALRTIQSVHNKPYFNVKIGMGSPQVENVTFDDALEEFDRCIADGFDTDRLEYVFIYADPNLALANELNDALRLFNLGHRRTR